MGTSSFTGMVADFLAPSPPSGWLELDGSVISTATYSSLYGVMSVTSSGTRTNGSPFVTSIPDTSNFKAGYYIFGTGISAGTTILSVDSATQITMSGNAGSSGSSAFAVSPWQLGTGTIKLPDVTTAGRFRRSRTSSTKVGDVFASQNLSHTHSVTGNTDTVAAHTHSNTLFDPTHAHTQHSLTLYNVGGAGKGGGTGIDANPVPGTQTNSVSSGVTITNAAAGSHNHSLALTSGSDGGSEARPVSIVVITCVKT